MMLQPAKTLVKQQPEESLFLRVLWFLLTMTCLLLVNMADPAGAGLSLSGIGLSLSIPLMVLYLWLAIAGCYLSYHYRHASQPWLVGTGLVTIAVVIGWFVNNLHQQWSSGMDIDPLLPTVYLVAGLFVSHSFEMRTRTDFNFSLALSLLLVFMTATLGKGLLFGLGLLAYVCLAGVMLLLDCESRTFGMVCARPIDGLDCAFDSEASSEKTGNIVVPIALMVGLGVAFFIMVPRAEPVADRITAQLMSIVRPMPGAGGADDIPSTVRTIRSPIRTPGSLPGGHRGAQIKKNGTTSDAPGADAGGTTTKPSTRTLDAKAGSKLTVPSSRNGAKQLRLPGKNGIGEIEASGSPGSGTGKQSGNKAANQTGNNGDGGSAKEQSSDRSRQQSGGAHNNGKSAQDELNPDIAPLRRGSERRRPELLPEGLDTREPAPQSDQELFSVTCNRTVFFRKSLLDTFNGKQWYCSDPSVRQGISPAKDAVYTFPQNSIISLPAGVPAVRLRQHYYFEQSRGNSLVMAGAPDIIKYNAPELWIDVCGTVHSGWALVKGAEYTVVSLLPVYSGKEMMSLPDAPAEKKTKIQEALSNFLQVEDSIDLGVQDMAANLTGSQGNWYAKAQKIAVHLRKNYSYKDRDRHSGTVEDTVNNFLLVTKSGDCKDFASAFVILCRCAGIPARFVSGFTAGDFDAARGRRVIKEKHAHAWAEVFVPGAGWVPFDATPAGILPERTAEAERYLSALNQQLKTSLNKAPVPRSASEQASQSQPAAPGAALKEAAADAKKREPVSVLAVMLALCCPGLLGYGLLMFWRSLHNRRAGSGRGPATKIYVQFLRKLKMLGVHVLPSSTAEDVQQLISAKLEQLPAKGESKANLISRVARLVELYNAVQFGDSRELHKLKAVSEEINLLLRKLR